MNETTQELDLIRTHLRTAIERDLHKDAPRVPVTHRRSFRLGIPTLAAVAVATAAIVLGFTVSAANKTTYCLTSTVGTGATYYKAGAGGDITTTKASPC